jgi:hypothetical protein
MIYSEMGISVAALPDAVAASVLRAARSGRNVI